MLIEFRFKNYRSFRDEAVLSMEATGLGSFKKSLIPWSSTTKLLPAIAIYGKNGGGKSNVIRAFWLAVQASGGVCHRALRVLFVWKPEHSGRCARIRDRASLVLSLFSGRLRVLLGAFSVCLKRRRTACL